MTEIPQEMSDLVKAARVVVDANALHYTDYMAQMPAAMDDLRAALARVDETEGGKT